MFFSSLSWNLLPFLMFQQLANVIIYFVAVKCILCMNWNLICAQFVFFLEFLKVFRPERHFGWRQRDVSLVSLPHIDLSAWLPSHCRIVIVKAMRTNKSTCRSETNADQNAARACFYSQRALKFANLFRLSRLKWIKNLNFRHSPINLIFNCFKLLQHFQIIPRNTLQFSSSKTAFFFFFHLQHSSRLSHFFKLFRLLAYFHAREDLSRDFYEKSCKTFLLSLFFEQSQRMRIMVWIKEEGRWQQQSYEEGFDFVPLTSYFIHFILWTISIIWYPQMVWKILKEKIM